MHFKDTPLFKNDAILTHILGLSYNRLLLQHLVHFLGSLLFESYHHAHFRTDFHWIVTLVSRALSGFFSFDRYVSVSCTFRIPFHLIVLLVYRALF